MSNVVSLSSSIGTAVFPPTFDTLDELIDFFLGDDGIDVQDEVLARFLDYFNGRRNAKIEAEMKAYHAANPSKAFISSKKYKQEEQAAANAKADAQRKYPQIHSSSLRPAFTLLAMKDALPPLPDSEKQKFWNMTFSIPLNSGMARTGTARELCEYFHLNDFCAYNLLPQNDVCRDTEFMRNSLSNIAFDTNQIRQYSQAVCNNTGGLGY